MPPRRFAVDTLESKCTCKCHISTICIEDTIMFIRRSTRLFREHAVAGSMYASPLTRQRNIAPSNVIPESLLPEAELFCMLLQSSHHGVR